MNKKLIAGVAILCGLPTLSQASGFALIEMNARGQGNAYAGAAAYTPDASTVYFNPAGMMMLKENQIAGALHLILPNASFTNDGSKTSDALGPLSADLTGPNDDGGKNAVVPNFYWVTAINEDAKFGLGVNAPFGLETNYKDEWVGRYHAIQSNLRTINVNPSLAYRLNDQWSIGAGLDIMFGHVELSSAVDFGTVCLGSPPQGGDPLTVSRQVTGRRRRMARSNSMPTTRMTSRPGSTWGCSSKLRRKPRWEYHIAPRS